MRVDEKFGLAGIDDERQRRVLYPNRVVLTKGNVTGSQYLTELKPAQVAIYNYPDKCVLDNRNATENAAVLVDFGRELHGTCMVSFRGNSTASIRYRIRLGESVSEALTPIGEKGTTNDHATRDMEYVSGCWSSNETNESGFRFAYVELLTPDAFADLRCIAATLVFRDIEYKGSFVCNDPMVNTIFDTAAYTAHLNMQRYLWDGIKRDRLVWAGDMNTEVATILSVFGPNEVITKSLDLVKDITPTSDSMNGIQQYNLWWLLCHHAWYMATGDIDYLKQQKDYIAEMLSRYLQYVDENGKIISPMDGGLFDWPTQDHPEQRFAGTQGLTCLAFQAGGQIMEAVGESELANKFYEMAARMKNFVPEIIGGSKQAAAVLVESGICDAKKTFDEVISVGGAEGLSTFLGYFTLCAIGDAGEYEAGIRIMKDYWGKMIEMGATTFWEDFDIHWADNAAPITDVVPEGKDDIHGDFGAFCYKNLRHSLCHGWASGPAPFLSKYIMGIHVLEPGCKKILFDPHLGGLEWIKGTYPTPYGIIEVSVTKDGAEIIAPDEIEIVRK